MASIFITFSALLTALNNLFIRRAIEGSKIGDPYIAHRFLTAAVIALPIIYLEHGTLSVDPYMALVAVAAGLSLGLLQYAIGKGLQYGPSGLTFIFICGSCVLPAFCMFVLFGEEFGHGYSLNNIIGSTLVLAALYWMGKTDKEGFNNLKKWAFWIGTAFIGFTLYQIILQWRALLLKDSLPESWLLPFKCTDSRGDIFMIITFIIAAVCQKLFTREKHPFIKGHFLISGIVAGILSSISTFFLLRGTELAVSETEKAIIFPLNTVLLISACNSWASYLYKEKVNWPANILAAAGIIIAS